MMCLAITNVLWNSQQLPKMLTHLWSSSSPLDVSFLTPLPRVMDLTARLSILASNHWPHVLESSYQSHFPGFECVTLYCRGLTPHSPTSFVLFNAPALQVAQVHAGPALCVAFAPRGKGALLDTLTLVKDAEDKILSLATHPRTHKETHTQTLLLLVLFSNFSCFPSFHLVKLTHCMNYGYLSTVFLKFLYISFPFGLLEAILFLYYDYWVCYWNSRI